MQSCFFQRNRDGASFLLQGRKGAFRSAEVTAEQEQNRRRFGEGASNVTMKTPMRARGIAVKVGRWMWFRCFARAIGELLFRIAPARVENGQTKMRRIILRH